MPLNRLENFIKNIEGRILYVNPNDLDSTDSISNDGNSLAQPFKTIQRALIESARFSYVTGRNNDRIERTTILVYPGEHLIDNRPGFAIKPSTGNPLIPTAVAPAGGETTPAASVFSLDLNSNFDLTQEDNILYKYNSVNGGVVVPRGTSLVGLDLRKTKIRPKYVPNPTDSTVPNSALFRITGTCYFWQFSIFDGDKSGTVYTNNKSFNQQNDTSTPLFSHHKLTCFEYADGVNKVTGYNNTDLEMYYDKLSNAFNESAAKKVIPTEDRYPVNPEGFAPRLPEFEIVGAFASDPIQISSIKSGNGVVSTQRITVTTSVDHGLNVGTPVQIKGVVEGTNSNIPYNTSSLVQEVISDTEFTYLAKGDFSAVSPQSGGSLSVSNAFVTVETDTVEGASPYIFNCSLRSVYGMNGMLADGSKATGFRSMVVAQFTGISLQKDDRAFVKYDKTSRNYNGVSFADPTTGTELPSGAAQSDSNFIYHLDSEAIYRKGFETSHIKITNDAILQIVSVFAIGYNKHFCAESGGDASITNSNSNFGQISLSSDGFKKEAFTKDDTAYITSLITPKSLPTTTINVDWLKVDVGLTSSIGVDNHIYLSGFTDSDDIPQSLTGGYRIGAKTNEVLSIPFGDDPASVTTVTASVRMTDNDLGVSTIASGTNVAVKKYAVTSGPTTNILTIGTHGLLTGEKIRIFSDDADLPENIEENTVYYAIKVDSTRIKLSASKTDADNNNEITINGGTKLSVESRVHDKEAGDIGSPIFYDTTNSNWAIHVDSSASRLSSMQNVANSDGSGFIDTSNTTSVVRIEDARSLDDKLYKLRVVVPKEVVGGKNPEESFVLQESSSTGYRNATDYNATGISTSDYNYNRNLRFIGFTTVAGSTVTVTTALPHNLNVDEDVNIKNVKSSTNTTGEDNLGYNGTFNVTTIVNSKQFKYNTTDVDGLGHDVGTFTAGQLDTRDNNLPRFERNDVKTNFYIYRNETISPYIEGQQDGIYHIFALNASNTVSSEFTDLKYSQNVVDLYPQLDRDNPTDNPSASASFAKRSPLGDVATNFLKDSLTRETSDKLLKDFGVGLRISSVGTDTGEAELTFDRAHNFGSLAVGIVTGSMSAYTNGTHYDVKLLDTSSTPTGSNWNGATANVTVSGGAINLDGVEIVDSGASYSAGTYYFDNTSTLGAGNNGASYTVTADGIRGNVGDVVQVTGIGTETDSYSKITQVNTTTKISIAKTSGDPLPVANQFLLHLGSPILIGSTSFSSSVTTFNTTSAHGLSKGSAFRVLDSSNNNAGDFTVKERNSVTQFTATTTSAITNPSLIVRHGMSANNANSDVENENLAIRGLSFYGGDVLTLTSAVNNNPATVTLEVDLPSSGIGTMTRFPLGSYIQIDNEIMRIASSTLSGSSNNELTVIRGVLGSDRSAHDANSLIRKIDPLPVEFRRPSILRASGHTFEYVGYGPGNYSTGLPQVQVKTLTEREEFLSQSQERGAGAVVYTGMNNRGDFFIGNKRVSSTTGQERTCDAPIPTVTGEDPSRLSVIFDEVIVKERILVEGGRSNKILSQFDGPVTFNSSVKFNDGMLVAGTAKFIGTLIFESETGDAITYTTDSLFNANAKFKDNKKILIGNGTDSSSTTVGDTELYHNASNTILNQTGTGDLKLQHGGADKISVTSSGASHSGTSAITTLTVSGTSTLNGNVTLGNSTGDTVTFTADVDSNILPSANGTKTLGDGSNRWQVFGTTGNFSSAVTITDSTASTDKTTGALIVTGGAGISGALNVGDDITAFATSDKRLKDNIVPIPNALDKVVSISGNTFDWNDSSNKKGSDTGVIAQEVEELELPGVTTIRDDGTHAVRYEKLVPLLIEAIKELKNEVDELKKGK